MNINLSNYETTLSDRDFELLEKLKQYLADKVELPRLGYYSSLDDEELWLKIVLQFCVMGGTKMIDRLIMDERNWNEFRARMSLRELLAIEKNRSDHIAEILKDHKATRFVNKQARKIDRLLGNQSVIKDGRLVLLHHLSHNDGYERIRRKLMERNPYFRLKSASDFMIVTGLSHDVIALDTRIAKILREHFDLNVEDLNKIQRNERIYLSIEQALRDACNNLSLSLAHLDRILFRYSGKDALSFVLEDL